MLEGGGRLCPVMPVNTYNEPLDRQLMERVMISNFKGEVLMNRRTEMGGVQVGGGVEVATKTKQNRRISHNQLGGRSLRYVEESASPVTHPRLVTIQSPVLNITIY